MKTAQVIFITLTILTILTPTNAQTYSIRCGVRLISEGDSKAKVLAECGDPDHVEVWEEERVYRYHYPPIYYGIYDDFEYGTSDNEYRHPYRIKKLVIVEEWTYNHGPSRFMDHLRLENGVVIRITSGDYGY